MLRAYQSWVFKRLCLTPQSCAKSTTCTCLSILSVPNLRHVKRVWLCRKHSIPSHWKSDAFKLFPRAKITSPFQTLGYSQKMFKDRTWVCISQIARDRNGKEIRVFILKPCRRTFHYPRIHHEPRHHSWPPYTCWRSQIHTTGSNVQTTRPSGYSQPSPYPPTLTSVTGKFPASSAGEESDSRVSHKPRCDGSTLRGAARPPRVMGRFGAFGCIHLTSSQHAECQLRGLLRCSPQRHARRRFKYHLAIPGMSLLGPRLILMEKDNRSNVKKKNG